ncbi:hypothetical protein [Kitasatospora sp. NPDC057015]|uniref:hypothetical protein n=1 Tax=Kitasatospora sp. NPDC057015 TaxID=3346001 RepID=UPI0036307D85
MSGGRRTGGRAVAHLLLLCAVLAGLFLMHGAPTSAGGCHDAVVAATLPHPMPGAARPGLRPEDGRHEQPRHEAARHTAGAAELSSRAPGTPGPHGRDTRCLATKSRDGVPLPAPAPVTSGAPRALPTALATGPRPLAHCRRAPPGTGRRILLRICVART